MGSVNMDPRSARLNTELSVVINSPPLTQAFLSFMSPDRMGSLYQVQLTDDGQGLRWHAQVKGQSIVHAQEPHNSAWSQFTSWLQSLWVDDELL
jgi:cardiolipin synthase C